MTVVVAGMLIACSVVATFSISICRASPTRDGSRPSGHDKARKIHGEIMTDSDTPTHHCALISERVSLA